MDAPSVAEDVSADGSIAVGWAARPGQREQAVFWDAANNLHRIDQVLVGLGIDLSGWTLHDATGISDDGLTIVGSGTNPDGLGESWIAVIPEPGTALLLGLGLLGLAVQRRS